MEQRCTAPKEPRWKGLKALFEGKMERCGKPATKVTVFGPYCEACLKKLEEDTENERNLLGIVRGVRRRSGS
jgi:hypothetical protein